MTQPIAVKTESPLPRAVVISLADHLDRRESCRAQLDALGEIPWKFLDAIDGRGRTTYPDCYRPRQAERIAGYRLATSEVACFMSHRLAWWECHERDEAILILEDDFLLMPGFSTSLRSGMAAQEMWDVLRLQGLNARPAITVCADAETSFVRTLADPWGSTAYVVTPAAARMLLAHSRQIIDPVDTFLEAVDRHRQRLLAVAPYPVGVTGAPSSMTDRPVRWAVGRWQRRRRRLFQLAERLRNGLLPPVPDRSQPPTGW